MSRKNIVLWTVMTLVAVLVAGSAVVNAQRGERRRGFGPGARGMTFGVELSAEQREQIRGILTEQREQGPDRNALRGLNRQLQLELLADNPDQSRIDGLRSQILDAERAALERRVEVQQRIAQILTPEQRAQARQKLTTAPQRRQGRR
jgi:Spy/CpxP family protein refolding chaperone